MRSVQSNISFIYDAHVLVKFFFSLLFITGIFAGLCDVFANVIFGFLFGPLGAFGILVYYQFFGGLFFIYLLSVLWHKLHLY